MKSMETKNMNDLGASPRRTCGDAVSRHFWFLESEKLRVAARRKTGLQDFGDPPIEPALSILTTSLEAEANLHPLGRFLMRMHLQGLLETRLKLADAWRHSSSEQNNPPIRRPIFITGMPRSGSTFLHELLAEDPANRAPRIWEVMFPIPGTRSKNGGRDFRERKAAACLWWFRRLAPKADAVFPMRARTPHECVAMHSYTFLSEEFVSTCRVPSYEKFLRSADLRPAYEWQKKFLQHLQTQDATQQWVLKSPDHVYGLKELFAVFPDALVIHTHRNPLEVLKSSCQLTEVLHGLYARPGSKEELKNREAAVLAGTVERAMCFRDAHPELADRFLDVRYTDLIADPLAVMRRIYQQFELPLTEIATERIRAAANSRTRYRGGRNMSPVEFSAPATAEKSSFQRYCSRFSVAWQSQAQ
jgi:hypothetical protein